MYASPNTPCIALPVPVCMITNNLSEHCYVGYYNGESESHREEMSLRVIKDTELKLEDGNASASDLNVLPCLEPSQLTPYIALRYAF